MLVIVPPIKLSTNHQANSINMYSLLPYTWGPYFKKPCSVRSQSIRLLLLLVSPLFFVTKKFLVPPPLPSQLGKGRAPGCPSRSFWEQRYHISPSPFFALLFKGPPLSLFLPRKYLMFGMPASSVVDIRNMLLACSLPLSPPPPSSMGNMLVRSQDGRRKR